MLNDNGSGIPLHDTFAGQAVDANSMLFKYSYKGDADLNGILNADDYARIDAGFATHAQGYENGDFDLSGAINSDDYFYIDYTFSNQGSALAAITEPTAPSALFTRQTRPERTHQARPRAKKPRHHRRGRSAQGPVALPAYSQILIPYSLSRVRKTR